MESMQQYDFIIAFPLGWTLSSRGGCSNQDRTSSVGRFQRPILKKNAPIIYQIQKSIASLSQGTMTILIYFTKFKGLWGKLETYQTPPTCNQMKTHNEDREEDRMMQFLMGLNDTYSGGNSNILMMTPLPNVSQAYALVIQDETQRQIMSTPTENFSIAIAI